MEQLAAKASEAGANAIREMVSFTRIDRINSGMEVPLQAVEATEMARRFSDAYTALEEYRAGNIEFVVVELKPQPTTIESE